MKALLPILLICCSQLMYGVCGCHQAKPAAPQPVQTQTTQPAKPEEKKADVKKDVQCCQTQEHK